MGLRRRERGGRKDKWRLLVKDNTVQLMCSGRECNQGMLKDEIYWAWLEGLRCLYVREPKVGEQAIGWNFLVGDRRGSVRHGWEVWSMT